ncbi:uncharacterized protein LOC144152435 isoform X1 [Haemaphysalis longicornis]
MNLVAHKTGSRVPGRGAARGRPARATAAARVRRERRTVGASQPRQPASIADARHRTEAQGNEHTIGRLEGLELGVPAACFGQRFRAWGAPCADVTDRARRGLFTARPRRLSIVGVRLGLRYAKALHARLGAWSPHQQPPGMLQRCLPAGPLSAFSTLSRRRIDVAFTWLQRAGLFRQVRTPL